MEKLETKAVDHTIMMNNKYAKKIRFSIDNTRYYTEEIFKVLSEKHIVNNPVNTKFEIVDNYIVEELLQNPNADSKSAVLNFASYKYAGGHFIYGAMAQEEALCHGSFLYNVLSADEFERRFYYPNRNFLLNKELYHDKLLVTPKVIFEDNLNSKEIGVITCAAPNAYIAKTKHGVSEAEVAEVMRNRIRSILLAAYDCHFENLFLGAFGCGVFGNNPDTVAGIFKELFETEFKNAFKYVAFVIPKTSDGNYTAFQHFFSQILH